MKFRNEVLRICIDAGAGRGEAGRWQQYLSKRGAKAGINWPGRTLGPWENLTAGWFVEEKFDRFRFFADLEQALVQ